MENSQVAAIFDTMADMLELQQENVFRIRSYRSAAMTIRELSSRLEDMVAAGKDLAELPAIGKATAEKIHEILKTGSCDKLEELRRVVPESLTQLMRIPQLGPRKAMQLFKELNVATPAELLKACQEHRVRELPHMGEKTEENIVKGLEMMAKSAGRVLYKTAEDQIAGLCRQLRETPAVKRFELAGSFRRRKETIADLDVLIQAADRPAAAAAIAKLSAVGGVEAGGEEKLVVRLGGGLQVDFRFFEDPNFGAAWMYFTGSKAHNIAVRKIAVKKGWKLSEYGLFEGDNLLAGAEEKEIYARLGLQFVPPELREDRGEVDAAAAGTLPDLVEPGDIRGDLQSHTTATDGEQTIEEMAAAAAAKGYEYFAITDHSKRVTMAHGLNDAAALKHAEAIRKAAGKMKDFWLMAGIEVDILKDGSLDLAEATLRQFDWVVGSVHYDRNQDERQMTDRLVAAIGSGLIHCIGHPLGRKIGMREAIRFDTARVYEACAKHGVFLEVNAQPDRLDLPDTYCKDAMEAGVTFTISTDAHRASELDYMPLGVYQARRGWLSKKNVVNTRTLAQFRKAVRKL